MIIRKRKQSGKSTYFQDQDTEEFLQTLEKRLCYFIPKACFSESRQIIQETFQQFEIVLNQYDSEFHQRLMDPLNFGLATKRTDLEEEEDQTVDDVEHSDILFNLDREMDLYYQTCCVDATCLCHRNSRKK